MKTSDVIIVTSDTSKCLSEPIPSIVSDSSGIVIPFFIWCRPGLLYHWTERLGTFIDQQRDDATYMSHVEHIAGGSYPATNFPRYPNDGNLIRFSRPSALLVSLLTRGINVVDVSGDGFVIISSSVWVNSVLQLSSEPIWKQINNLDKSF